MKVRWKEHEMTAVRILVLWQIIVLLRTSDDSPEALNAYSEAFNAEGLSFIYWRNVMLPQVCSVLLMFAAYLSINLLILPSFRKVFGEFPKRIFYRYIVMTVISMLLVSYLLAIGINIISFYGRPHLFNYKDFQFLSLAGYNDQPLTNLFFGFDRTVIAVIVVTALGGLRDLLIRRIEQPGPRREFNILVTNSATPLLIAYIVLVIILNPVHHDLQVYFLFGTPLPLLYLYLMFWLFPFKREKNIPG